MAKAAEMKAISVEIAVMVVDMVITFGTTLSFYDIGFEALGRMVQVSWFIVFVVKIAFSFLSIKI